MQHLAIVNPGLEELAQQEIKELINEESEVDKGILKFSADEKQLSKILQRNQSFYKLLAYLGEYKDLEEVDFSKLNLKDFFNNNITLKIEVENVKGQENRQRLSKIVGSKLFPFLKESNIKAEIDFKTPNLVLVIYHTDEKYFLGVDLTNNELNKRDYRVFAHSASFKGDFSYYFSRESGFKIDEKLLLGFCKDGVIAIEAALYSTGKKVHDANKFMFKNYPLFKDFKLNELEVKDNKSEIYCFDEGTGNTNLAKRNASLVKVKDDLQVSKYQLDELDVKFNENFFDRIIFHITSKDEDRINEIYYQANYILKKGGTLMFIGRSQWEVSISDKFELVQCKEIVKGDSSHKAWLLKKK